MKYLPLLWAGLWRRPVRTTLTMLSVLTAFFLFGVLQGVNAGVNSVFDLMNVARLRVSNRANFADTMPVSHVARIKSMEGVAAVSPLTVLVGSYQQPKNVLVALGVDFDELLRIIPEFQIPADQLAALKRTRTGVMVGKVLAERYGWKVGDRIPLHAFNAPRTDGSVDWALDITAIYDLPEHNWANQIWTHYDYIDEGRTIRKSTVDQILVRVANPDRSAQIAQQIDAAFMNSAGQTMTQNEKAAIQSLLAQVGDIGFMVNAIVGAVLFALLFLTANTMMQSIRERIPELAVLRTVGFSENTVIALILAEAMVLGVTAALIGLAAAARVIPQMMGRVAQDLTGIHMPASVFGWGVAIAVLLALASGLPPALRARRMKLVDALAGR